MASNVVDDRTSGRPSTETGNRITTLSGMVDGVAGVAQWILEGETRVMRATAFSK